MSERIEEKVKKLLAIARRSTNQHEIANALSKAQALLKKYGLSSDLIALSSIGMFSVKMVNQAKKVPAWSALLATVCSEIFGVEPVRNKQYDTYYINFIGVADRAQIAAYVYDVLSRQLMSALAEYSATFSKRLKRSTVISRRANFCEGWLIGVSNKVRELVPTQEEVELTERYKQMTFGHINHIEAREAKKSRGSDLSRQKGYISGLQVELNHGVPGEQQKMLAG